MQAVYNATTSYQARFEQTYVAKVQDIKKTTSGLVTFEKPGKMAFIYDEPNGNRVVSDGKLIKVYEKSSAQMYEMEVGKSQYPAALSFLMGQGQLAKDFTLKLLDAEQMKFEGGIVLEAVPKDATPVYSRMLLYIDSATSHVRRVLLLDAQGNRNRFDFSSTVVNRQVPPKTFVFTPPDGTKVVKQ